MKLTTQNIYNTLKQPIIVDNFYQLKSKNPIHTFQETTLTESYDNFVRISELIIKTTDNNLFDDIPFTKRSQIWGAVSSINQQLNQCKQFGFNFVNGNVINFANSIIQQTINLIDFVETSNLFAKSIGLEDYKEEVKKLSEVRKKYQDLLNQLTDVEKLQIDTDKIFKSVNQINTEIGKTLEEANKKLKNLSQLETDSSSVTKKTNESFAVIKENEKEIESKKLQINTFAKNIEEYKESINKSQEDAKNIIAKEEIINNLISSAEKALNLKSAEGISAAFSSHYTNTSKKHTLSWWIFGASLFIACAIGLTIWIVLGDHADAISAIIGRIVAVAISITGATFCAKQYVKQKNILEDYAYKSVLAKSIVAFTEEIKKRDDKKVADYLSKVLEEIHKDPLRTHDNNEDKNIGINTPELVEKLVDILSKFKK